MRRFITKRDFILIFFVALVWWMNNDFFPYYEYYISKIFSLEYDIPFISISSLFQSLMYALVSWLALSYIGQDLFTKFKLKMPVLKFLAVGVSVSILDLLVSHFVTQYTMDLMSYKDENRWPFSDLLGSPGANIFFFFFSLVPVAIEEEIFFRGLCYDGFRRRHGLLLTILFNNFIFIAFHPYPEFIPAYFIGNTIVCLIYERYKSLPLIMLIHILYNTVSFFMPEYFY